MLDEPTAGVDPKARREFWNEIHALAHDGLTVLVSTHYMDEAERCHEIAYIAYGQLLTHGTVEEVIAQSALITYTVNGAELNGLQAELTGKPGIDMVAPFGNSLHVSGRDEQALEATIAPYRARGDLTLAAQRAVARRRVHRADEPRAGQFPMSVTPHIAEEREPRFGSLRRTFAMLVKEFIQLKRDRVSFAMIIMIPVMQLLLFGYAINTTPRNLPTAVLLQEDSDLARSVLKALENTAYFRFTHQVRTVEEFDNLLQSGTVLFGVEIPRGFERAVRRGEHPALLVAADATDPGGVRLGDGGLEQDRPDRADARPRRRRGHAAAVRGAGARALQPGRGLAAEHRARPDRHDPDLDHADLHRAVGDARGRARHDGGACCRCRSRRSRSCSARSSRTC